MAVNLFARQTAVRYAPGERAQQIFAARYQLHLPTEEELRRELEAELASLPISGLPPVEPDNQP